jgi:hypothetical protein
MKLSTSPALFFLSLLSASDSATLRGEGAKKGRRIDIDKRRRLSKGKGKGSIFEEFVDLYEDPPAGVIPGDRITSCEIKLDKDLDWCRGGGVNCLNLEAFDGDTVLDCDGRTIAGYHDDGDGLNLDGSNGCTITVKNCIVSGMGKCIYASSGSYNVVLEDVVVIGCEEEGVEL